MKKLIYALILPLVVVSGLVFANRETKNTPVKKSIPKQHPVAESETAMEKWKATPQGIAYTKWEASPNGKKIFAGAEKLRKQTSAFSDIEAVVTDLSLPTGSKLGFGVMARINGEYYILSFGLEESNEFQQLHSLKVNDKIIIRSRAVSWAPKYAYPIVSGDYAERDGKIMYKRIPHKGGC